MINALEPPEFSDSITLVGGTAAEIGDALRRLGASKETIAKSCVSFLVKLPGKKVRRVEGGFQIGQSFLPETQSEATREITNTQNRFAGLMAAND